MMDYLSRHQTDLRESSLDSPQTFRISSSSPAVTVLIPLKFKPRYREEFFLIIFRYPPINSSVP